MKTNNFMVLSILMNIFPEYKTKYINELRNNIADTVSPFFTFTRSSFFRNKT